MQIPRFFLTPDEMAAPTLRPSSSAGAQASRLTSGDIIELTDNPVNKQIKDVLRLRAGDCIDLLDGLGGLYRCELVEVGKGRVAARVLDSSQHDLTREIDLEVGLALLKGDRFDWSLQKLTEIGASRITPLLTERTVVKTGEWIDAKKLDGKLARWHAIVKEAAEQCERPAIPQVVKPKKLSDFIRDLTSGGTRRIAFICSERIKTPSLKDRLTEILQRNANGDATTGGGVTVIIGPEGGFDPKELEMAQTLGVEPVSLGRRILRSDTAAIYAAAQIVWMLEN